jgi:uridine phosphorylase
MNENQKWVSEADRPELADKLQYHIRCKLGDVADTVLLPGDPARVAVISGLWDESREIAAYREHVTHTGKLRGVEITACSTGAGGGSTASALEELAELGAKTLIRVGTTSAIQPDINPGDVIISAGAVRFDGTSEQYVVPQYPAVANYTVVAALVEACEKLGYTYHVGITATTASFFCGQNRTGFGGYRQSWFETRYEDLRSAGVLNYEMETATVLTLASLFKIKAGAIFTVLGNRVRNEMIYGSIDKSVKAANEAALILHSWENKTKEKNKKYWFPSL